MPAYGTRVTLLNSRNLPDRPLPQCGGHFGMIPFTTTRFNSLPHFERVVVGAGDDLVVVELEARDDVLVVALQHARRPHRPRPPVQLHVVIPHEVSLKWIVMSWLRILKYHFYDGDKVSFTVQ